MKRVVKSSIDTVPADLYVQYLNSSDIATNNIGVRSMSVKRPSFLEAVTVMLEHLDLYELDLDYDEIKNYTKDKIIDAIAYAGSYSGEGDYILYFENRASGEVFIDENYPEENY